MNDATPISRTLLRDETQSVLLDAILEGRLEPGSHAQEHVLARELQVSRTPLREALLRLELEGFLVRDRCSRLFVRPLSAREARELHELVGGCEASALRRWGLPSLERLDELRHDAESLAAPLPSRQLVELDRHWHRLFLAHCWNAELLGCCDLLRRRLARYELLFVQAEGTLPQPALQQKRAVLSLARTGSTTETAVSLESYWHARAEPIVSRLTA